MKVQTFKTAIESACLLLRIDNIVSGIKKKEKSAPSGPVSQVDDEKDADGENMIPE